MGKTVYEVEEFLKKPLELKREIRAEEDHIASLRSIVDDRTTHLSHTAGRNPSKNNDAFENVMLEIVEAEKDLEEKRQKLTYSRRLVEALINQMPGEKERQITIHILPVDAETQEIDLENNLNSFKKTFMSK